MMDMELENIVANTVYIKAREGTLEKKYNLTPIGVYLALFSFSAALSVNLIMSSCGMIRVFNR